MLELLQRTRWDQIYNFLASGDPPLVFQLLALNTVILILFIFRRARGLGALKQSALLYIQGALIFANTLILFQNQITQFLDRSIRTISNTF